MKGRLRFATIVADGIKKQYWILLVIAYDVCGRFESVLLSDMCASVFLHMLYRCFCEVFHGPQGFNERNGRPAFLSPVLFLNGCSGNAVCMSSASK